MTTPELQAAVERLKKRSCVSEQGALGLLWTVFEGEPFCSRRIASFATQEDAREYVYTLPTALEAAQQELVELRRDKERLGLLERTVPE